MSKYRHNLPQLDDKPFLTDGGLETTLIYHEGIELPYFAAFDLLKDEAGFERLHSYFMPYADLQNELGASRSGRLRDLGTEGMTLQSMIGKALSSPSPGGYP
ncbi:hypothetical protein ABZN20_16230 [Methylococcus sp. ANG]|uniref:hypothetical protein n=1 Tax=Methylococcus sp. ANG TaxID=3231903 RepID=UPI0034592408